MAKWCLILALAAIIAGTMFLMARQQAQLRSENRALHAQLEQLILLQADNQGLSNRSTDVNNPLRASGAETGELLRLRGEVSRLRRESGTGDQRPAVPGQNLNSLPQPPATGQSLPKSSWAFVGYSNAESAFESAVWAMNQGNATAFREGWIPQGQGFADWKDLSDEDLSSQLRSEAEKMSSFTILDNQDISDSTAVLTVLGEGTNGPEVNLFRMQRVESVWKLAGTGKQD